MPSQNSPRTPSPDVIIPRRTRPRRVRQTASAVILVGEGIEQIECRFRVVAIHTIAVSQDCRGHAAATDLPDKDDAAESLMTGGEVNAMLLVLVVKGAWTEDVDKLQRERHHDGVLDLAGCGHVG